jgi:recombinational DNA repair protein RecR
MEMMVVRVNADSAYHAMIEQAAQAFEGRVSEIIAAYKRNADGLITAEYIEPITDTIQITTEP